MSENGTQVRSRRSLLAAMTGGLAAYAARAFTHPERAAAGTAYVELGGTNTTTSITSITNQDVNEIALLANARGLAGIGVRGTADTGIGVSGIADSGIGVHAQSASAAAVFGSSTSGLGVFGRSGSGRGIWGQSSSGHGLYAESFSASAAASVGTGRANATGVLGYSGPGVPPGGPLKTGVYGYAAQDDAANGVIGQSTIGTGVRGVTTSGTAVLGLATNAGVAVYAVAVSAGRALRTEGRLEFDTSGLAPITVGTRSTVVSPGYGVDTTSRVLCTLESKQPGLFIQRVTKDISGDSFRVVLSQVVAAGKTATVAWLLIG